MEITSVDVILPDDTVEEHKGAVGHGVGGVGELIVQYAVSEMDETGGIGKRPYPAVTYAPGTWKKVLWQGARGGSVVPIGLAPKRPSRLN